MADRCMDIEGVFKLPPLKFMVKTQYEVAIPTLEGPSYATTMATHTSTSTVLGNSMQYVNVEDIKLDVSTVMMKAKLGVTSPEGDLKETH